MNYGGDFCNSLAMREHWMITLVTVARKKV